MTTNGREPRSKLPLDGIRVLDITVVWAGPYSTMQLGDWGAEVIRVESTKYFAATTRGQMARPPKEVVEAQARAGGMGYPDNDAGKRPWNRSAVFNAHGRNKRSVTIDLTSPEGQEAFERLIAASDGLIENNVPISMEKWGVTYERLSKINPRLIMVRMPAFGLAGPYKNYRTWGNHMEALSGHPLIRAYPDLSPEYAAGGVPADAAGGIGAAFAFTLGLRYRRRTGKGLMIEAPTAENFVPLLGEYVMDYTMNGRVRTQLGNEHWTNAPHNTYRCQGEDRWITVGVWNEEQWRSLCGLMQQENLVEDSRFINMASRFENRHELDSIIGEWTGTRQPHWLVERLQAAGVPSGIVMNERDALEDRHLHERGFWHWLDHPEAGNYRHVGPAWKASQTPNDTPRRHAPLLGQDNEYVYKTVLGYTDDEYRNLEEKGQIGMDFAPEVP